jgi:DNA-binding NtrC family response regulator
VAKILILDDEKDLRNLLAKTLELEGYQVKTAERILDAWTKLSNEEFNLVLSEKNLSDGLALKFSSMRLS